MIKVLQGWILKFSLHSVNSVLILFRTGNIPSAILLSFVASSSQLLCELQSTHWPMPCYISPYVVYITSIAQIRTQCWKKFKKYWFSKKKSGNTACILCVCSDFFTMWTQQHESALNQRVSLRTALLTPNSTTRIKCAFFKHDKVWHLQTALELIFFPTPFILHFEF